MDGLSMFFLLAMFTPGLIRGAFWSDSPAFFESLLWIAGTIGAMLGLGWASQMVFGAGLGPTMVMALTVVVANLYALKGTTWGSGGGPGDDIDGDANG